MKRLTKKQKEHIADCIERAERALSMCDIPDDVSSVQDLITNLLHHATRDYPRREREEIAHDILHSARINFKAEQNGDDV